ncbi:uncharacterized protein UBRO_14159 [Ustilago bromivora]|uniref:DDE Tnp4 domain-containing protein n=1 Tax=Ustilago bromivora TaxID=307758 RepID=A0A1K0GWE4_9BASI|nr:uncharacterized protein UBRO_14159 [Ustilago bromivora]
MEDERANALAWVVEKSGVEEWGRGWLVTDGTHIKLVWKPALHAREHFSYQGNYLFNVSLVFLPHSLHIVKSIIGHPGSSHDSCVWASGDNGIVAKPCLHLDEGEFVWVDAGFGFSAFSVGSFNNNTASKSHDIQYFNYFLSHIWIHAEHGIAYLKNHFQCLMGYCGNLYHEEDHERAAYTIQACIVAHTFASQYDHPDDVADYLLQSFSEEDLADVTSGLPLYHQATEEARIMQQDNQAQYEQVIADATQGMSQNQMNKFHADWALDLREEMFSALFVANGRPFEDTTAKSRRKAMTTVAYNKHQGWQSRQTES